MMVIWIGIIFPFRVHSFFVPETPVQSFSSCSSWMHVVLRGVLTCPRLIEGGSEISRLFPGPCRLARACWTKWMWSVVLGRSWAHAL
jgi:hypothetical protein